MSDRTPDPTDTPDAVVTIRVQDLFSDLKSDLVKEIAGLRTSQAEAFGRLETALAGKADATDLAKVEAKVDQHGTRLITVERWQHDREVALGVHQERDERVFTKREKILGAIGTAAIVLATLFGPTLHIHL